MDDEMMDTNMDEGTVDDALVCHLVKLERGEFADSRHSFRSFVTNLTELKLASN